MLGGIGVVDVRGYVIMFLLVMYLCIFSDILFCLVLKFTYCVNNCYFSNKIRGGNGCID